MQRFRQVNKLLNNKKLPTIITLDKRLSTDSTDISGDVPDDFDSTSEKVQFTMDGDKTFGITFSEAPIPKIEYTFTAGNNGSIDIVVEGGASYTIEANGSKKIEFLETHINASKVKATAKPNNFYLFDKWSYNNSEDNPLTITSAMAGTITANFKSLPTDTTTFTFSSGANGDIYLNFLNRSTGASISNKIIAANTSGSTTLSASLLTTQKVEARASGNFVNPNYYVIDKWSDNSKLEIREIDLSSPTTLSVSFKTGNINYGTGTAPNKNGDWYEIYNKDELIYVANQVNAGDATFRSGKYRLMDNIDYKGAYHYPIGLSGSSFTGVMDGNNKVISNAKFGFSYSSGVAYTGFIGGSSGAIISNLTIDSSCVINTSSTTYVGSIVASGSNGIGIYNSVNKADIYVYGSLYVGGVVGLTQTSTISNVYNTGNIYVDSSASGVSVGGIIGVFVGSTYLKNAYNTGNITYKGSSANARVGGVIGNIGDSLYITNVYNSGTVTSLGETKYTGGVIGYANSSYTFEAANGLFHWEFIFRFQWVW